MPGLAEEFGQQVFHLAFQRTHGGIMGDTLDIGQPNFFGRIYVSVWLFPDFSDIGALSWPPNHCGVTGEVLLRLLSFAATRARSRRITAVPGRSPMPISLPP